MAEGTDEMGKGDIPALAGALRTQNLELWM